MKKRILAVLLAVISLLSFASCGGRKKTTADNTEVERLTLPGDDSLLFGSVPKPKAELTRYNSGKDKKGYTYQWEFKGMSYDEFKDYVNDLKKVDFAYFSTSVYANVAKEPAFKKTAEECGYTASWLGVRSGLYVSVMWYGDEFFEKHKITGPNCRVMFYTYNPFATENASEASTAAKAKK